MIVGRPQSQTTGVAGQVFHNTNIYLKCVTISFCVTLYLKCVTFPLSIVFVHINNHIFLNVKVVDWFGDLFGEGDYLDYEEDYEEVFLN